MSAKMAPTRRMTAGSLGKMPTTRARRLISLLTRSSGLVDHTLGQWLRGKAGEHFGFGLIHQWPDLGEGCGELVADAVPGVGDGAGVGLGEDRPEYGGDHVLVGLGHQRQ